MFLVELANQIPANVAKLFAALFAKLFTTVFTKLLAKVLLIIGCHWLPLTTTY